MNTEQVPNRCPKCQAPLPDKAPQGLCPKCLLAAAASPTEGGQPTEKEPPPRRETVAVAFPHLEILELIGHGGMGLVYKARQPKLDRFVALKLLPQSLAADPAFAERFNREARVLAKLNHPNIVTVHDFGQSGGFFYLLMEYVDGVNLRQAMQAGRFTPQQAMMLVPRICEALQFAHDEGILHRDIKPENILLDTRGRVKIADFGIAKLVGEAREQLALTASGLAVGTPHYMAPEQLEHPQDVDQRADIYSVGVVFYEMLTGELPIGRFAPPSKKTPVDPRVDEIVFHALEKEREKRFRTAREVKTSVEAIASTGVPSQGSASAPQKELASTPDPGQAVARSVCYFNTPQKMKDCFPSAAARIFTCKGELVLGAEELTFTTPWQTTIHMPLKDIDDLSVGQFQMWTTPWVMNYARVNFLAITFRRDAELQTIHLTPVPPHADSASEINLHTSKWFEQLQQAIQRCTGKTPHKSDPEWMSVSAERAWNRKGLPLTYAFALSWLAAWILLPQRGIPLGFRAPVFIVATLLLIGTLWFCFGFLRANRALWRADLDAVTSDEPPEAEASAGIPTTPFPRRKPRFAWLNASFLGAIGAAVLIAGGMLLWEAWVFPLFGQSIFGGASRKTQEARLVIDTISTEFGSAELLEAREKLKELRARYTEQHPLVLEQSALVQRLQNSTPLSQMGAGPSARSAKWKLKSLVPPNQLARVLFVRWIEGKPKLEPSFSAYFKTRQQPADIDYIISCHPEEGTTNALWWNVNLDLGHTSAGALPVNSGYRLLDLPVRTSVASGRQEIIRLLDEAEPAYRTGPSKNGVELRILLEPLQSPAVRALPFEKEYGPYIGGSGFDLPVEQLEKLVMRLPVDQQQ